MSKPDGGPAFPRAIPGQDGMTLRDYFAIHCSEEDMKVYGGQGCSRVEARYAYADAMLSERNKP